MSKGAGGTIAKQVKGDPTKYISASETADAAAKYSSGNGLVEIDVDAAINAGAGFVDHGNVLQAVGREYGRGSLEYSNASGALEVMFKGSIPRDACKLIK
jgi:hypothetical protein